MEGDKMNLLIDALKDTKLNEADKKALNEFVDNVGRLLAANLESVVLYGSAASGQYISGKSDINILVLLKKLGFSVLKSLVDPAAIGRSDGIAPFFLSEADISLTADIFLEFPEFVLPTLLPKAEG
jgi:hypothetical protein